MKGWQTFGRRCRTSTSPAERGAIKPGFSTYILAYGKDVLHVEAGLILWAVNLAAAVEIFTIPLWGILSDSWSRKGMYLLGNLILNSSFRPRWCRSVACPTPVPPSLQWAKASLYEDFFRIARRRSRRPTA
jgi:MFS family permease